MTMIKKYIHFVLVGLVLILTTLLYSNHFNNPFEFDDSHSIVTNDAITEINVVKFFSDASCLTSLPGNQSYRPVTVLLNALDYQISKKFNTNPQFKNKPGLNPYYYHLTSFFWYLLLIVVLYVVFFKIFQMSISDGPIHWFAFFATCLFSFHTANAETINYIGGRTDSFSTLCIATSLLLFMLPKTRRYKLYYLTVILAVLSKQTGLMILPILFFYVLFFELKKSIFDLFTLNFLNIIKKVFRKIGIISIIATLLFIVTHFYLTPEAANPTNQGINVFTYITTQFYVILLYVGNFILPTDLSVDHGLELITPFYDKRILLGLLIIILLMFLSYRTSKTEKYRCVSFGILWFFFALVPTSLVPLFQVSNDHRLFFAFIGLVLVVSSFFGNIYNSLKGKPTFKFVLILFAIISLSSISYGNRKRNIVWQSSESLWLDAATKNPKNGRALMNYGLSQMEKGNYDTALDYYNKALLVWPNYSTLHTNLGIIYGVKNDKEKADYYFKTAIDKKPNDPAGYYFYARFLQNQDKEKSKKLLQKALQLSPNYSSAKSLLANLDTQTSNQSNKVDILYEKINSENNESDLIELSQLLYSLKRYENCIEICNKLLNVNPKSFQAFNNLCVSYNQLGDFKNGVKYGKLAVEANPNSQLAKNNLNWAISLERKNKND